MKQVRSSSKIQTTLLSIVGTLLLCLCVISLLVPSTAQASQSGHSIKVGAFLNDVSDIDVTTGKATFDLYMWVVSAQPFDAEGGFEIINGDGTVRLVESKTRDDGKSYQLLRVLANSKQRYDMQDYPFDRQTLHLKFDFDPSVENTNIDVVADRENSARANDIILPGWQLGALSTSATQQSYPTSWGDLIQDAESLNYPEFTISLAIERETPVYLVRYFSVIIFAGFLAMLGLFLKPGETTRISLGIGAYISLSASNLVIANKLPVTDTLNFSDHVIIVTGSVIIASVLYSLVTYHLYGKTPAKAETIDRVARAVFPLAWLASLAAIFSMT